MAEITSSSRKTGDQGKLVLVAGIAAMSVGFAFAVGAPAAGADPIPAPSPVKTDDRGFVDSAARCDDAETVIAFGRTQRSLVAICADPDGTYQYRGVRISDDAALAVAAERTSSGGFEATNEGVTYAVSSNELLITSGDTTLFRESMVEYHAPRLPAEGTPSR